MKIVSEYKYQIAMETAKQNTSRQVSVKETAFQNVCKYSIFFFETGVSTEKQKQKME